MFALRSPLSQSSKLRLCQTERFCVWSLPVGPTRIYHATCLVRVYVDWDHRLAHVRSLLGEGQTSDVLEWCEAMKARVGNGFTSGTGILMPNSVIFTNNHVIMSPTEARQAEFVFNFNHGASFVECTDRVVRLYPGSGSTARFSSMSLDFTAVSLTAYVRRVLETERILPAPLWDELARVLYQPSRIFLCHHPGGGSKVVSSCWTFGPGATGGTGAAYRFNHRFATMSGSSGGAIYSNDSVGPMGLHYEISAGILWRSIGASVRSQLLHADIDSEDIIGHLDLSTSFAEQETEIKW